MEIYKYKKVGESEKYSFVFRENKSIVLFIIDDFEDPSLNFYASYTKLSDRDININIENSCKLERKSDIDKIIVLAWEILLTDLNNFDVNEWEKFRYAKRTLNLLMSCDMVNKTLIENNIDLNKYKNKFKEHLIVQKADEGFFISILLSRDLEKVKNKIYFISGLLFKKMKYSVSSRYIYDEIEIKNDVFPSIAIFDKNKKTNIYYQIYKRICLNINDKRDSRLIKLKKSASIAIKELILQDKIWREIIQNCEKEK